MPSFDIVSEIDTAELRNAVENTKREITNRYDFRGVDADVTLGKDDIVSLRAEADLQCRQMLDILRAQLIKRNVDPAAMEADEEPEHSGKTFTLQVRFKQGIDTPVAKQIVKRLKDSKLKVQAVIQGDQVRVTGKKRDDLQAAMALVREADLGQPFQFDNFRD